MIHVVNVKRPKVASKTRLQSSFFSVILRSWTELFLNDRKKLSQFGHVRLMNTVTASSGRMFSTYFGQ